MSVFLFFYNYNKILQHLVYIPEMSVVLGQYLELMCEVNSIKFLLFRVYKLEGSSCLEVLLQLMCVYTRVS